MKKADIDGASLSSSRRFPCAWWWLLVVLVVLAAAIFSAKSLALTAHI